MTVYEVLKVCLDSHTELNKHMEKMDSTMRYLKHSPSTKCAVLENAKNVQPHHLNTPFNVVSFCSENNPFSIVLLVTSLVAQYQDKL